MSAIAVTAPVTIRIGSMCAAIISLYSRAEKSIRSCDCHNHCFVRSTRVTYTVIIVKVGKVGAEMQGLAQRIPGITLKH